MANRYPENANAIDDSADDHLNGVDVTITYSKSGHYSLTIRRLGVVVLRERKLSNLTLARKLAADWRSTMLGDPNESVS